VGFHYDNFQKLCGLVEEIEAKAELSPEAEGFLRSCEEKDSIFPEIDLKWWLSG
jgi:hypothetical protein